MVHAFPKGVRLERDEIARLEFEFAKKKKKGRKTSMITETKEKMKLDKKKKFIQPTGQRQDVTQG